MADATLEGLPSELRIMILCGLPDSQSLKSLVLASPTYHSTYIFTRKEVLEHVLENEFGNRLDFAEALTAVRSKGIRLVNRTEEAIALLDIWRRRDEITDRNPCLMESLNKPQNLEEALNLHFLCKTLNFFLEDFSTSAPTPPWILSSRRNQYLPLRLSLTEQRRFFRALCRLQIAKNMFGPTVDGQLREICEPYPFTQATSPSRYETMEGERISFAKLGDQLFYAALPPWEFDEMASLLAYLDSKVCMIADEVYDDMEPCIDTECGATYNIWKDSPSNTAELTRSVNRKIKPADFQRYSTRMTLLGPEFIYRALTTDWTSRQRMFFDNCRPRRFHECFDEGKWMTWSGRFPHVDPAERIVNSINFEKTWSSLPAHRHPNSAWGMRWLIPHSEEDTLKESMQFYRFLEIDRSWCYALWDEARLTEWELGCPL